MIEPIEHWLEFENNGVILKATPAAAHNPEGKRIILDFMNGTHDEIEELIAREDMRIERKLSRRK